MNTLIVLAHPERTSYNAHLSRLAAETLKDAGHAVEVSDLYGSKFDSVEDPRHFQLRCERRFFDVQLEQRHSFECESLPRDVAAEIARIVWADFVILQFPIWWFGLPAILKGWMDRVFVYGGMYSSTRRHDNGVCAGKRAMLSVTTGSDEVACSFEGREGDTRLILWPAMYALRYLGFTVLEPSLIHGVGRRDKQSYADERLTREAQAYRARLLSIEKIPSVQFNADGDYDARGRLLPSAPVFSPFIRHDESSAGLTYSSPNSD